MVVQKINLWLEEDADSIITTILINQLALLKLPTISLSPHHPRLAAPYLSRLSLMIMTMIHFICRAFYLSSQTLSTEEQVNTKS